MTGPSGIARARDASAVNRLGPVRLTSMMMTERGLLVPVASGVLAQWEAVLLRLCSASPGAARSWLSARMTGRPVGVPFLTVGAFELPGGTRPYHRPLRPSLHLGQAPFTARESERAVRELMSVSGLRSGQVC